MPAEGICQAKPPQDRGSGELVIWKAQEGRDVCVQGLSLPCVFCSLVALSHQAGKSKAASNMAFVLLLCCTRKVSGPTSGSAGSGHHHVLLSTQINCRVVFVWHRLLFCIFRRGITK